jgi:hypothetical protein
MKSVKNNVYFDIKTIIRNKVLYQVCWAIFLQVSGQVSDKVWEVLQKVSDELKENINKMEE